MGAFAWIILAGGVGLVAGSFLSTLAVRWPRGESVSGRSHCDHCGAQLRALELLPLLAFVWQGGRCRHCHARIDARHPLAELAGAGIGILALLAVPGPAGFIGALFGWWLLALIILDLDHYWLPDRLTLPLLALGLLAGHGDLELRLAGAALGGGGLWLLARAYRWRRGRDGLGLGDVKLLAALGAWLGPYALGPLLLLAAILGILLAIRRRRAPRRDDRIAFGACLAAAAFPLWLAGASIYPF